MLAKRIIPCLDVTGGRVVKGVNFIDLVDAGDPVEIARKYDEQGADELVFLDITASSDARETMVDVVRRTAEQVFIPLTVGGGIRSVEDIRRMLLAGADKTSVNTSAILRPDLIREGAERFGSQCIVLAIDARKVPGEERWIVYTHGGRNATELDAVEVADLSPKDLRIDVFRASGAGGQHVQKTDSAVRITHLPTGLTVECQDERSQTQNKARAMAVLAARLYAMREAEQKAKEASERKSLVGSGDRSERIRTYNFPQGRVTDHRINLTLYRLDAVLDGDLDELISALTMEHQASLLASSL